VNHLGWVAVKKRESACAKGTEIAFRINVDGKARQPRTIGQGLRKWGLLYLESFMTKIAEHTFSRLKVSTYSVVAGLLIGLYSSFYPPIDFSLGFLFFAWLAAAIVSTVFLHEAIHAGVAVLFGCKPIFGLRLPLVFVTFNERIPRGRFIAIALAPLIVLDAAFGILYSVEFLKVFSYFCLIINTLGSVGDLWIAFKLVPHERGTLIQDTKTGVEVWKRAPEILGGT
jgi:hypothetical protein